MSSAAQARTSPADYGAIIGYPPRPLHRRNLSFSCRAVIERPARPPTRERPGGTMQNFGPSEHLWSDGLGHDGEAAAEARWQYARKRAAEAARERCLALEQVVQTEIIPQLVLLHRKAGTEVAKQAFKPSAGQVATFTDLTLLPDHGAVIEAFSALVAAGHPVDRLFLDLLAPSAALLGRMWDEDLCDFVEVTTAVARLQHLVARFRADDGMAVLDGKRRLLLMGAPGEQHTLGVQIVEQFLTRAGWAVSLGLSSSPEEITDLVASEWFGVVGLTLSSETRVDQIATAIRSVREASCNRSIGVMVGGPMFLQNPDLVHQVGADASAVDAATAVLLAQRLLDLSLEHDKM
ncbi:cobalamin B12-binding domain-containing protein [Methylobacterium sp. E-065]|uniref:cobalamin B12-binding domain-containing protein n=1 Tax=Methylobacterium sp. E-065 TaxID=2836583 RepID=UPI001FB8FDD3|nr:cobalamin B12-binding domain-containing protein [Methylobacterium sp. E-065]MCJ2018562.1 cobalamin B12-binding domain-containing protein [Methylobacterium sp. E-065]